MNKLTNIANKAWNLLSGKKTAIGVVLHAAWFIYYMFIAQIESELQIRGHGIVFLLTGTGLIHKVQKQIKK